MTTTLSSQEVKKELIQNIGKSDRYGKDTANRLINVINGYGKREGFFNKIAGLFYRIWNVVKAIFGKSDWQLARKAMNKDFDLKHTDSNDPTYGKEKKTWYRMTDVELTSKVKGTYLKFESIDQMNNEFRTVEMRVFFNI